MRGFLAVILIASALAGALHAQTLLKDCSPGSDPGAGSDPRSVGHTGETVVFTRWNPKAELWACDADGNSPRKLADFPAPDWGTDVYGDRKPGQPAWSPHGFVTFKDKAYFVAASGEAAQEIWVTDGTPEGTRIFIDKCENGRSGHAGMLTVVKDKLFFVTHTNRSPSAFLYVSDGTVEGTKICSDLDFNELGKLSGRVAAGDERLWYFADNIEMQTEVRAYNVTTGEEEKIGSLGHMNARMLWVRNGRAFIHVGPTYTNMECWTIAPGEEPVKISPDESLILSGGVAFHGDKWWLVWHRDDRWYFVTTDGTAEGTKEVHEMAWSTPARNTWDGMSWVQDSGLPLLVVKYASFGIGVWRVDGEKPERLVRSNGNGGADAVASGDRIFIIENHGSRKTRVAVHNAADLEKVHEGEFEEFIGWTQSLVATTTPEDDLVFVADRDGSGRELFIAKGDRSELLLDLVKKPLSSEIDSFLQGNGFAWYVVGTTLWRTDGTPAGTIEIADKVVKPRYSSFQFDTPFEDQGRLCFWRESENESLAPTQLWETDGTVEGTKQVTKFGKNVRPVSGPWILNERCIWIVIFNYDRDDFDHDFAVVATDAGGENPVRLPAAAPFTDNGTSGYADFFKAGERLLFRAGKKLYSTDGTREGTALVCEYKPTDWRGPETVARQVNDRCVFWNGGDARLKLWHSDGTPEGTGVLADFEMDVHTYSSVSQMEGDGRLFLRVSDGDGKAGLWATDGTPEGTHRLATSTGGKKYGYTKVPGIRMLAVNDGRLVFTCYTAEGGEEPWVSDGTAEGTKMIKELVPGEKDWNASRTILAHAGKVYAIGADAEGLGCLWVIDGTAEGTRTLVKSDKEGKLDFQFDAALAPWKDKVVCAAPGTAGVWITDGTESGTIQLLDEQQFVGDGATITPAETGFYLHNYRFRARSYLWWSDGTPEGTRLLRDDLEDSVIHRGKYMVGDRLWLSIAVGEGDDGMLTSDGTVEGTLMARGKSCLDRKLTEVLPNGRIVTTWNFEDAGIEPAVFGEKGPSFKAAPVATIAVSEPAPALTKLDVALDGHDAFGHAEVVLNIDGENDGITWSISQDEGESGLKVKQGESWTLRDVTIDGRVVATFTEAKRSSETLRLSIIEGASVEDVKRVLGALRLEIRAAGEYSLRVGISDGHEGVAKTEVTVTVNYPRGGQAHPSGTCGRG